VSADDVQENAREKAAPLRFEDVQTFLAVCRTESITAAARALDVTPSQVSKAVSRLEEAVGAQLLARGARGVSLTPAALRIVPELREIAERVANLRAHDETPVLTIAAAAYLQAMFLPTICAMFPNQRVRGVELPPALVRASAGENFFDMAIVIGRERFPDTWVSESVGELRKCLFATPTVAAKLGPGPVDPESLARRPFVVPVYRHEGRFWLADEGCPIADKRTLGHEVQTIALALEVAARTDQLVFGPRAMAARLVASGALVEVEVRGWDVRDELFVACNGERMLARDRARLMETVRSGLAAST
jgi:DNA-binding transcriptional LysR family regulator